MGGRDGAGVMISRRQALLGSGAGWLVRGSRAETAPGGHFEVTPVTLFLEGLDPEHEGLRVAQLSDVHVGMMTPDRQIRAAVEAVNALSPELVVLTGDYVTTSVDPVEKVSALLGGLERCGFSVLENQHTELRLRHAPFRVIGVGDAVSHHEDVSASFRGCPARGSRLVLAHNPGTARRLPRGHGLL